MIKTIYRENFDVAVIGGGVSGCAAAISAARNGARVILIEQNGYLGGALTACGVGPMMTFHAGKKQVIRGFMQELVDRLVARGYSVGHIPDTKQYTPTVTPFNSEGMKLILDEMASEAGVTTLFHTFVGDALRDGAKITAVKVCNKDGINAIRARVYIDATGDGDIAAFAGVSFRKGRESDGAAQPMTLKMKYCCVDTERLKSYILDNPEKFKALTGHFDLIKNSLGMDVEGFDEEFKAEKLAGRLSVRRENVLMFGTGRAGEYIINTTRIIGKDATDALSLSESEIEGRKQCAELDSFLRKYVHGFENALLEFTGPSVGVRGSRQIVGEYTLTEEDILTRKRFRDVIAHSSYPIDVHDPNGEGTHSRFISEKDSYYSIPYSISVTKEIDNLIVTGRCVSATFEAQAAIRTTPTVGSLGQAAGIAASIAARTGESALSIDINELQATLIKQGAYLDI